MSHLPAEQRALTTCTLRSYYGQQRSIDAATAGEERCAQRAEQGEAHRRAWQEQEQLAERRVRPLSFTNLLLAWALVLPELKRCRRRNSLQLGGCRVGVCARRLAALHQLHGNATSSGLLRTAQAEAAAQLDLQRRAEEAAVAAEAQRRADAEQANICEAQARRPGSVNRTVMRRFCGSE